MYEVPYWEEPGRLTLYIFLERFVNRFLVSLCLGGDGTGALGSIFIG